jgi:hypothetical protein
MQQLHLDDLGSASANAESDVATFTSAAQIETGEENAPQIKKGETVVEPEALENTVPNSPSDEGIDVDLMNTKIAESILNSLVDSVPNTNVVLDASTFLAQDQPQADMVENMQEKDVNDDVNTVKTMSAEEDLVVINVLNVSGK